MVTAGVEEEDLAVQAARILVTLRNRKLLRWPEWVEKEPATPVAAAGPVFPLNWSPSPKRRPSGGRRPGWGNWLSALKKLDDPAAAARRQNSPACDGAPSGSGPSTSAAEKASVASAVSELSKEPMEVQSPETPLDYAGSAAGSGASSSGDDAARSPSKRRASGSACSADEGCSTPDKRARVAEGGDEDGDKAISVSLAPFPAFSFLLRLACRISLR
jgi:hypothetical protein